MWGGRFRSPPIPQLNLRGASGLLTPYPWWPTPWACHTSWGPRTWTGHMTPTCPQKAVTRSEVRGLVVKYLISHTGWGIGSVESWCHQSPLPKGPWGSCQPLLLPRYPPKAPPKINLSSGSWAWSGSYKMVELGWQEARGHCEQRNSVIKGWKVGMSMAEDSEQGGGPCQRDGWEIRMGMRGQGPNCLLTVQLDWRNHKFPSTPESTSTEPASQPNLTSSILGSPKALASCHSFIQPRPMEPSVWQVPGWEQSVQSQIAAFVYCWRWLET